MRHTNVISPSRSDSIRLCSLAACEKWTVREKKWTLATPFQNKIYIDNWLRNNSNGNQTSVLEAMKNFQNKKPQSMFFLHFFETRNRRDVSSRINSSVLKRLQKHYISKSTESPETLKWLGILSTKDNQRITGFMQVNSMKIVEFILLFRKQAWQRERYWKASPTASCWL